jgi:hypothetical protein
MSAVRTDLPDPGTVWRDRYAPRRTIKVTGAAGDAGPVVSSVLTDDTGEAPAEVATVHTKLSEWDWMYEAAGLGARA